MTENTNIQNCHRAYDTEPYLFHQKLMYQYLSNHRFHMHYQGIQDHRAVAAANIYQGDNRQRR